MDDIELLCLPDFGVTSTALRPELVFGRPEPEVADDRSTVQTKIVGHQPLMYIKSDYRIPPPPFMASPAWAQAGLYMRLAILTLRWMTHFRLIFVFAAIGLILTTVSIWSYRNFWTSLELAFITLILIAFGFAAMAVRRELKRQGLDLE